MRLNMKNERTKSIFLLYFISLVFPLFYLLFLFFSPIPFQPAKRHAIWPLAVMKLEKMKKMKSQKKKTEDYERKGEKAKERRPARPAFSLFLSCLFAVFFLLFYFFHFQILLFTILVWLFSYRKTEQEKDRNNQNCKQKSIWTIYYLDVTTSFFWKIRFWSFKNNANCTKIISRC